MIVLLSLCDKYYRLVKQNLKWIRMNYKRSKYYCVERDIVFYTLVLYTFLTNDANLNSNVKLVK